MRILVLGGTGWLGRLVAQAALGSGHAVTCVARGGPAPEGAELVRADRQVDDALSALPSGTWDAVVDVATQPGQVRRAVRDLRSRTERYLYVSSCSVYASLAADGIDEESPVYGPLAADTMASRQEYGPAKVACEEAVVAGIGPERAVVVRPGLIGGPGDPTGRSTYWPLRFARPSNREGRVLVPDDPAQPTAVIDVRDLAAWLLVLLERRTAGIFNAVGEAIPLAGHLAAGREVAGHRGPLVPASPQWLVSHGVSPWVGPRSLPLWLVESRGIGSMSNARARAAGLTLRPVRDTLADTLAWAVRERIATVTGAGLDDADEQVLLAALDGSAADRPSAGPHQGAHVADR